MPDEPILGIWLDMRDAEILLVHVLSMLAAALVECELDIPADAIWLADGD